MITIDIETIPGQNPLIRQDIADTIKHPGNISKQETIDKWVTEKKEAAVNEAWRKTALNATKGELLCFGYAFDDNEPEHISRTLEQSEFSLLCAINDVIGGQIKNTELWVGHNITGFDLRFL